MRSALSYILSEGNYFFKLLLHSQEVSYKGSEKS